MTEGPNAPMISIFSIPHIVDQIAIDLNRSDTISCCCVCRSWNTLFLPHIYRELVFRQPRYDSVFAPLAQYTHFVRSLTLFSPALRSLPPPVLHLTNLQTLRLFCRTDWHSVCWDLDPADYSAPLPANAIPLTFLRNNPRLTRLDLLITHSSPGPQVLSKTFLMSVKSLHMLKKLECRAECTATFLQILPNLPESLQELALVGASGWTDIDTSLDQHRMCVFPRLKLHCLKLEVQVNDQSLHWTKSLLQSCPELRRLDLTLNSAWTSIRTLEEQVTTVVDTLAECCSTMLQEFVMCGSHLDERTLGKLIRGCPHLNTFLLRYLFHMQAISVTTKRPSTVYTMDAGPSLLEYFALPPPLGAIVDAIPPRISTLTTVGVYDSVVRCELVPLLLTSCPHLRELQFITENKGEPVGGVSLLELTRAHWACADLRILVIPLTDRRISTPESRKQDLIEDRISGKDNEGLMIPENQIAVLLVELLQKLRSLQKFVRSSSSFQWNPRKNFDTLHETAQVHLNRLGHSYTFSRDDFLLLGLDPTFFGDWNEYDC